MIFPHHENELAIAMCATDGSMAKYRILCDRVMHDGKQIDKRENCKTLEDLTGKGFTGKEIRYWFIANHYRKPMTFSKERLTFRKSSLARIDRCIRTLANIGKGEGEPYPEANQLCYDIKQDFTAAMDNDLNVSAAIGSIFTNVKKINKLILNEKIDMEAAKKLLDVFKKIDTVLGIFSFEANKKSEDIEKLIAKREAARKKHDWETADRIRDELLKVGVSIEDAKSD